MLPIDDEFLLLYGTYLAMLIILIAGKITGKRKSIFKKNLIAFFIYTSIMIFLFSNEDNFKYGSSLMMLFLGALFVLIHFLILLVILIIDLFQKNKNRSRLALHTTKEKNL